MPAYVIFIKNRTRDAEALKVYGQKAGAARGEHKITPLAFYGPLEVLEGDSAEGVVLLQFPDKAAARPGTTARPTRRPSSTASKARTTG